MNKTITVTLSDSDIELITSIAKGSSVKDLIKQYSDSNYIVMNNRLGRIRKFLGVKNNAHLVSIAYQRCILKVQQQDPETQEINAMLNPMP